MKDKFDAGLSRLKHGEDVRHASFDDALERVASAPAARAKRRHNQHYDVKPTAAHGRAYRRIVGEKDE